MNAVPRLSQLSFSAIEGWDSANLSVSLEAFRRSAEEMLAAGRGFSRPNAFGGTLDVWRLACGAAMAGPEDARGFFERHFNAWRLQKPGLLTGYYEAEAKASRTPDAQYRVPIYRKPPDLEAFSPEEAVSLGRKYGRRIQGKPQAYWSRAEIEQGALAGKGLEMAWVADGADAFFIHIQGSGRLNFADGAALRIAYAGKNGAPYTPIGRLLAEMGEIPPEKISMQALRAWLAGNPDRAPGILHANESYIFFREAPIADTGLGPPGAQQVQLTPYASLAIDRAFWAFGTPVFADAAFMQAPQAGVKPFRQLLIAQDAGSAIRGPSRGDLFCGAGPDAAITAGHLQAQARFTVLLPKGFMP